MGRVDRWISSRAGVKNCSDVVSFSARYALLYHLTGGIWWIWLRRLRRLRRLWRLWRVRWETGLWRLSWIWLSWLRVSRLRFWRIRHSSTLADGKIPEVQP